MANIFNSIRVSKPKRTKFNLSHDVKLSCNMGQLVPFLCEPVVPGDTWKGNSEILIRFAPLKAPVMHRVNVYTHFFFVPTRLLWSHFEDFITGGESGKLSPSYPRLAFFADAGRRKQFWANGSLADYLGFPTGVVNPGSASPLSPASINGIDALPFRAYQLIWNEYYRDQNLQDEVDIMKDFDGQTNDETKVQQLLTLRYRCWHKDYFTSALPWPQRGDDVMLPLTGDAKINGLGDATVVVDRWSMNGEIDPMVGGRLGYQAESFLNGVSSGPIQMIQESGGGSDSHAQALLTGDVSFDKGNEPTVDLSNVNAATINELRRAVAAQRFLETGARGGARYIEQIMAYFGVKSSDARLQRPEYLGGGKTPVVVSDVLQTSETTDSSPQAQPAGNAVSVGRSNSFKRFFEEHGYVIGIMSVMPVTAYQQGIPRKYSKFDRLDYFWPQFAHLGEQEIRQTELYIGDQIDDSNNFVFDPDKAATFGYAPRYAEYKFINSSVHGDFRDSLNFWHMGRIFGNSPNLNGEFVTFQPGTESRVFAVEDTEVDKLWVNIRNNINAVRPMPKYGTPGTL